MKKKFFTIFVLLFVIDCSAQNLRIADSLRNLLVSAKEDTNQVLVLNELSRTIQGNVPRTQLLIAKKC